jgi:hypothetical protein
MKKIFSVLMAAFFATALVTVAAWGGTTYTWTGATDNLWTTTTNWNPTRTTPANTDIIQFSAITVIVTAVPTQTIGQLSVSSSSTVTLQAGALSTVLTIGIGSGGSSTDLFVESGSALNISGSNTMKILVATTSKGSISGNMTFSGAIHNLDATDASGITFNNGATFTYNPGTTSGNAFTNAGTGNAIIFASGSSYIYQSGANPFGLTAPSSKVTFQLGSLYSHQATVNGTPSFSNRTYADVEIKSTFAPWTVTGGSPVSINNLTITSGTLNFNMIGTAGHSIKGNISVLSGQTLNFAPASVGTVNLNGLAPQSISGSGTITTNASSTININNSNGISLGTNLLIGGTLAMTQGNIALGGNTITLGLSGTTITTTGTTAASSPSITSVASTAGVVVGMNISGTGIPAGVTVLAFTANTITLSANATASGTVTLTINSMTTITTTGNTTSGSTSIASVGSTAGVVLGMGISGAGIPVGTTVTAFTANTITLSANATATGTGVTLIINSLGNTLTYTAGFLTGSGTFARWFATAAISGNAGLFPMGVGSNNRSLAIGGSPSTGGTISVSYNDASTVSAITFTELAQNYVNRYDANWVVTPSGSYEDPAMTLTIHGDGIPGITSVTDLDLSFASVIASGVWAAPSGSTSAPVLTRNGLTQGTIVTNPFYIASKNTSPLPVELASFTALAGKNSVELAWNTATEVNNYGFEVERAIHSGLNGLRDWQKIGFVSGNGNSNAPHNYSFTDNSAMFGTYSYRLKQIDRNGNFEYSKEVEAAVTLTPNTMVLGQNYPNPFNPETSIEFAVPATGYTTLKVYNTLGKEIVTLVNGNIEAGVLNQVTFKGSNFPSGLYFYTLRSGSFVDTKKMLMVK